MKHVKSKIITFCLAAIIGFLIAGNFSFQGFNNSLRLNAKEYQDAIETKNKLLKEIGSLKSDNREAQEKIDEYKSNGENSDKIVADMRYQLEKLGMLSGLNEVSGEGLVIIINDGVFDNSKDTAEDLKRKTLHDSDMFFILNELKLVGAEAISINEHRISPLSAVACKYAFLEFEDGDMVSAPFNIYVIGDREIMKTQLLEEGSYLRRLQIRGISVEVEDKKNITMKASNISEMKYIKEYIKK